MEGVRINKYLADRGICARREADRLIAAGEVLVNGRKATLGERVFHGDEVRVTGPVKKCRYYAYYKPRGIISHGPAEGEKDIAAVSGLEGVFPLGRLDKDSEGLIILTNDGRVTKRLLSPESGHEKEYLVTTGTPVSREQLAVMEKGMRIEGGRTKPCKTKLESLRSFRVILTEGKKRQIRRMCRELGIQIETLKRIRIMKINLSELKENQHRELSGEELKEFKKSLGL